MILIVKRKQAISFSSPFSNLSQNFHFKSYFPKMNLLTKNFTQSYWPVGYISWINIGNSNLLLAGWKEGIKNIKTFDMLIDNIPLNLLCIPFPRQGRGRPQYPCPPRASRSRWPRQWTGSCWLPRDCSRLRPAAPCRLSPQSREGPCSPHIWNPDWWGKWIFFCIRQYLHSVMLLKLDYFW